MGVAAIDLLDGADPVLPAQGIPDEPLEPIEPVEDDRLVVVRLGAELAQGGQDVVVGGRQGELVGGDLVEAIFGGDEDGPGRLRAEGSLPHALGAVDQNPRRLRGDAALHSGQQAHALGSWGGWCCWLNGQFMSRLPFVQIGCPL
ncbi:MAG: hypothetical protein RMJ52_06345 [Gemmataceae bacterium]|nr:hypothetical protein [Gemmataceae bacterium]